MKFRNFLNVSRTPQQNYFKDGVELLYPDQGRPLFVAILPAFDPGNPDPSAWIPAVSGDEESDFYTTVRAAKFVGHGNRRAKTSFLSPKTFDLDADDPYEAFYEYCSRSDKWSYLTKDRRGKRITGEVEGAIIPRMKNFLVANVMDVTAGSRGGVYVTELSESVAKSLLYSVKKNGTRLNGIAFEKDDAGHLAYGDITNPDDALVVEIVWGGKGYVARPAINSKGEVARTRVPATLLQHRRHMEEPGTFLVRPDGGQEIVDRLAGLLRGYRSEEGEDELNALREAMEATYGKDRYTVGEDAGCEGAPNPKPKADDPFADAAEAVVEADFEEKSESVDAAVERGVKRERYIPLKKPEGEGISGERREAEPPEAPGEEIDPSDIAAMRAMLSGGAGM